MLSSVTADLPSTVQAGARTAVNHRAPTRQVGRRGRCLMWLTEGPMHPSDVCGVVRSAPAGRGNPFGGSASTTDPGCHRRPEPAMPVTDSARFPRADPASGWRRGSGPHLPPWPLNTLKYRFDDDGRHPDRSGSGSARTRRDARGPSRRRERRGGQGLEVRTVRIAAAGDEVIGHEDRICANVFRLQPGGFEVAERAALRMKLSSDADRAHSAERPRLHRSRRATRRRGRCRSGAAR